jgi:hypothetical protein
MAPIVTLTQTSINSGSAIRVLCDAVRVGWKNNVIVEPSANGTAVVEAQTQGFENPTYVLSGVHFTSIGLTYAQLLSLAKIKYTGSNPITLSVTYGNGTSLVGSDGTSTSIKVAIKDFSFPIDVTDSKNGVMPIGSITLVETA